MARVGPQRHWDNIYIYIYTQGYFVEINLELGSNATEWSDIFVNLRLFYVTCSIVVCNITFWRFYGVEYWVC